MPRNKFPEETIKKILDVSQKLFLEKGYEKTTILDIVNDLGGMTRGAFYHHFKSKEDVLGALMEKMFQVANPFEKVKQETGLNGLEKIKMVMRYSVVEGFVDEEKAAMDTIAVPLLSNPRFLAEQVKNTQEVAYRFLQPLIEEGMADDSIQAGNAKAMAEVVMLFFNIWMIPTIFPCDREEAGSKIMMVKQMLDALGLPMIDEALLGEFDRALTLEYAPVQGE